jgi:hypothetical protein
LRFKRVLYTFDFNLSSQLFLLKKSRPKLLFLVEKAVTLPRYGLLEEKDSK